MRPPFRAACSSPPSTATLRMTWDSATTARLHLQPNVVILRLMKKLTTHSGRLFSAEVVGSPVTVHDCMVAADVYLRTLETQFETPQRLITALRAWRTSQEIRPGEMQDLQLGLAKEWLGAHLRADDRARPLLSDAGQLHFEIRLAPESASFRPA